MNKVLITGLLMAILVAITPVIQGDGFSWYSLVFAGALAATSVLTKNFHGQVWTILGIVAAVAANFFLAHPEPTGITTEYVLKSWVLPLILQILGAAKNGGQPKTE
jgi:uncharacterized membrane protein